MQRGATIKGTRGEKKVKRKEREKEKERRGTLAWRNIRIIASMERASIWESSVPHACKCSFSNNLLFCSDEFYHFIFVQTLRLNDNNLLYFFLQMQSRLLRRQVSLFFITCSNTGIRLQSDNSPRRCGCCSLITLSNHHRPPVSSKVSYWCTLNTSVFEIVYIFQIKWALIFLVIKRFHKRGTYDVENEEKVKFGTSAHR